MLNRRYTESPVHQPTLILLFFQETWVTKDRRALWVAMEKLVPLVLKVFATYFLPHSLPGSWRGRSTMLAGRPVLPGGCAYFCVLDTW